VFKILSLLQRNHRFYMLLLCSALAFYTFMFAFTVRRIRTKIDNTSAGVFSLATTLPESFVLAAFSFMTICALGCLLAFHAFLIAKNTVQSITFPVIMLNSA